MKVSAVLALRSLTSKLHPPLPLTPRESQQLLSLLTSSFREQLNREHPTFRADGGDGIKHPPVARSHGKLSKRRSSFGASSAARSSSSGFTDHHFQSILTNPLFAAGMQNRHELVPSTAPTHHDDPLHNPTASFDPIAWFESSVASGSATILKATCAMDTLQKILASSSETSLRDGMATSLAGSKVFRWLRSSGLQDSLNFSQHAKFMSLLTDYLLAEKRDDIIRNWFYKLLGQTRKHSREDSTGDLSGPIQFAKRLLLQLVKGKVNQGNGLKVAVDLFLRVIDDEHVAGVKDSQSGNGEKDLHSLVAPTGRYLVHILTRNSGARQLNPSDFERFIKKIKTWARDNDFFKARMHVYHPVKPSAAAALAYLKHAASERNTTQSPNKRRAIVHLSLESASLLLQQDRYSDATWVMDLVRRDYAAELGITQGCGTSDTAVKRGIDRIASVYNEISSLELLAGLDAR